jgi:hypothetical protein
MRMFYQSLSEKDWRWYTAIEDRKLGRSSLSYIARVLNCDRHTILAQRIHQQRRRLSQAGARMPISTNKYGGE